MRFTKIQYYLIMLILVLSSCKAKKGITDVGATQKMNIAKVIKKNNTQKGGFNSLRATLKVTLYKNQEKENITISLRMQKDEKIWMSFKKAGISGAKALITPTKIQYYNKLDKTFFEGNFSFISKFLGTPLSFKQLQAILLGNSVFTLEPAQYNLEILKDGYLLHPKEQETLFEQFVTLYPTNFKIKVQEIAQLKKQRILIINYKSYQKIATQLLPLVMRVTALQKTQETQIDITYKNVSLNPELRFPFTIPSGYKAITID